MTSGQAGNGVQPCDFQRFLLFQRRQQGWQLMRQLCFAATRWPHQQQVMSARGGQGQALACKALTREFRNGGAGRVVLGEGGSGADGVASVDALASRFALRSPPALRPSTRSRSEVALTTVRPSTKLASAASSLATTSARAFCSAARQAIARMPRQGLMLPSSPSSPAHQSPRRTGASSCPLATSSAKAIGRSKQGPSLRRSAGARFTTTRTRGPRKPLLRSAALTRSRDSWMAASGSPTTGDQAVQGPGPPPR